MTLWLLLKLDQKHLIAFFHVPWDLALPPTLTSSAAIPSLPHCPAPQFPSKFLDMWRSILPSGLASRERWTILLHSSKMPLILNALELVLNLKFHFLVQCLVSNCYCVCLWYYCFLKVRIGIFLFPLTLGHLRSLLDEWINEWVNTEYVSTHLTGLSLPLKES